MRRREHLAHVHETHVVITGGKGADQASVGDFGKIGKKDRKRGRKEGRKEGKKKSKEGRKEIWWKWVLGGTMGLEGR